MSDPIPPGGVVGVLGDGQLGRMLALAAARLGLKTHIYVPGGSGGAATQVCDAVTQGSADYRAGLEAFAAACDVVTLEFENTPLATLRDLEARLPVRPGSRALEISQDRLTEKTWLRSIGVDTAAFRAVDGPEDLAAALDAFDGTGFLKTRRMGYDGKGQLRLSPENAPPPEAALAALGAAPAILEAPAAFEREISVIAARGVDGEIACYDPAENRHQDGILAESRVIAGAIPAETAAAAQAIAARILSALDYVGVMGVEFFALPGGRLLVNEIAPRVHNSGHWTLEACVVSQFEQQVRAVCGWPLGGTARHSDAVMRNLIGPEIDAWREIAATPGAALHLYGKGEARPGRKMGHVTTLL